MDLRKLDSVLEPLETCAVAVENSALTSGNISHQTLELAGLCGTAMHYVLA